MIHEAPVRSGCLRKYRKTKLPYRPVGEPVNQGFGIRAVILPLVCAMAVAACGTVPDGPSEGAALSPVSAPASKDPVGQREYLANPGPVYDLSGETLFAADSRRDESRFFSLCPNWTRPPRRTRKARVTVTARSSARPRPLSTWPNFCSVRPKCEIQRQGASAGQFSVIFRFPTHTPLRQWIRECLILALSALLTTGPH